MGALLATLVLAIEIHAAGDCPGAAEVERQLRPLLGEAAGAGTSDVATIEQGPDGSVSVSLADTIGRAVGGRRLPPARSCDDQAETVAVTLAIWEAQLHPEISLRLDRLSPEAAPAPAPETTLVRPSPPAPASRTIGTVGVAAAGDWTSNAWSPSGRL